MTRRHALAGLLLAVLVGAIAAAVVAATRSARDTTARPIRVGAVLTPRTPLFGDTVTAQVEFAGDARRVVPGSVHVESRFSPYRTVAQPVLARKVAGDAEYVVWTASLRCLARSCVAGKAEKRVTFPPARVTYSLRGSSPGAPTSTRSLTVPWPALVVYSRIDPIEVQATDPRGEPPWRADLASLADVTYRLPPVATAAAVFGLSALLGLAAVALVAPLRRREEEMAVVPQLVPANEPLSPLELALAQLEHPTGGEADLESTRRALELVAGELRRLGETKLQVSAQRLAWSAEVPAEDAARELAKNARGATRDPAQKRGDGGNT